MGEVFKIPAIQPQILGNLTGTEEVIIEVGATKYPLVGNLGTYITSQMLKKAIDVRCETITSPLMFVQVGVSGTETVFFGRRGFNCRRTTLNVVTPPTP